MSKQADLRDQLKEVLWQLFLGEKTMTPARVQELRAERHRLLAEMRAGLSQPLSQRHHD